MKALDPGHQYRMKTLDGDADVQLTFVKRCDPTHPGGGRYPGNFDSYPGCTTQEVIRALIDRQQYVNAQIPHWANTVVIRLLRLCIYSLELRAARRHGHQFFALPAEIEKLPSCPHCGHLILWHQPEEHGH